MAQVAGKHSKSNKSLVHSDACDEQIVDETTAPLPNNAETTSVFKPIKSEGDAEEPLDGGLQSSFDPEEAVETAQILEGRPFARGSQADPSLRSGNTKKHKGRWVIVAATIAIILFVVVFFFVLHLFTTTDSAAQSKQTLLNGIESIEAADETVIALDKAMDEQVTVDNLESLQAILDQVAGADAQLDLAIATLESVQSSLEDTDDLAVREQALISASARKEMLESGNRLLSFDIAAMKSASAFQEAWVLIIDAVALSREAIELVAHASPSNVESSRDKNTQAIAKLDAALAKLDDAVRAFSAADFSAIRDYVTAEREALTYAVASDEAFLADDAELCAEQTELYNTANAHASELAAAIPANPTDIIMSAYDVATSEMRTDYHDARSRAASADAHVREYLGIKEIIANEGSNSTGATAADLDAATADAGAEPSAEETPND